MLRLQASAAAATAGNHRRLVGLTMAASLAAAASVSLLRRLISNWRQRRRMRAAIAAKRTARQRSKSDFANYLAQQVMSDAEEAAIASLPARQLVERLRSGRLKPDRVLLAFQRRAFRIDQRLNCVAEFLTPDLAEVNLDGPLAGLPVSVKENFSMKGLDSCVGCAVFIDQPSDADCLAVRQLKALGGVPFVRTIVPQTMLSYLSTNPIDGTVLNPANPSRCPGGSSSGEGALIAAGGSPLGLGSDIGGSIRAPAAWCGVAGFKPCSGRIGQLGMRPCGVQKLIEPSLGPMAPNVDSLVLLMEVMCAGPLKDSKVPVDSTLPPLGFNSGAAGVGVGTASAQPMTIGYYVNSGVRPAPCMERAVLLARDRLEARGHHLVAWRPPNPPEDFQLLEAYIRCVWSDGGRYIESLLRHDVASASVANFASIALLPVRIRRCLAGLARLLGDRDNALALRCLSGIDSVQELWTFAQQLLDYRTAFLAAWQAAGLDALLCPANATPAPAIDDASVTQFSLPYNVLANLLNLPAGVVPITRVTQDDLDAFQKPLRDPDGWHPRLVAMQAGTVNLPVAVQCLALPWRDETCLRLMRELEV